MRIKRNGRLVNVEDAHISPNGTETSVMAKNLIVDDAMILNGGHIGRIESVEVKVLRGNRYLTKAKIRNQNNKTFVREFDGKERVSIVEYPATRFIRRMYSRLGNNRNNYRKCN